MDLQSEIEWLENLRCAEYDEDEIEYIMYEEEIEIN